MKLTIWHGKATPLKAIGKHQCNLLDFAFKYQGWHSYSTDSKTLKALDGLVKRGAIMLNEYEQFRVNI